MEGITFVDNTTLTAVKRCALYAHYRHQMNWRNQGTAIWLDFGSAWHSAMDALYEAVNLDKLIERAALDAAYSGFLAKWVELGRNPNPSVAEQDEWAPRTPGIAKEMLHNYIQIRYDWIRYKIKLLDVERAFAVPIDPNDHTIFYIGRLDKVIEDDQGVWVVEHKTTTSVSGTIKTGYQIKSNFVESFSPNAQVDGYSHALHTLYGERAKGVLVDASLVHKSAHDVFRFVPVYRSMNNLEAWRLDALYWTHAWLDFKRIGFFPKNDQSCSNQFGQLCPYIGTCRTYGAANPDAPLPNNMIVEKWEPFDTEMLNKIAHEVLSGSQDS